MITNPLRNIRIVAASGSIRIRLMSCTRKTPKPPRRLESRFAPAWSMRSANAMMGAKNANIFLPIKNAKIPVVTSKTMFADARRNRPKIVADIQIGRASCRERV